ncbi:MBL fold metallo-hydrolase [Haloarcula nitratireducens]|uniref:MBL fold metallo-hydrolase n=1 Tax=Haloarcula nitratireducens TaxID=2487749 RepID=A0AAW4PGJ1_9EURY|nr:MBL fold metallo-hydrolase [Halomicroarcula nitratireducens]MBX0297099.1 MBL fold metallo-hydrolase [Halomicroarcula nitratireducens]
MSQRECNGSQKNEEVYLIDAGADVNRLKKELTQDHINILIITHFHQDHYQGAIGLLESPDVVVESVYTPPSFYQADNRESIEGGASLSLEERQKTLEDKDFTDLQKEIMAGASENTEINEDTIIEKEGISIKGLGPRVLRDIKEDPSVLNKIQDAVNDPEKDEVEVLNEMGNEHGSRIESADPSKLANENSAVVRISDGEVSHLFTGDIGHLAESEHLLDYYGETELSVDVLHVPHHGATIDDRNSIGGTKGNTDCFLATVSPNIAVVSSELVSRHSHPDPKFFERCSEQDIAVAWTGIHGDIDQENVREIEEGLAKYDPDELLKLRSVHRDQRADAAKKLKAENEIVISDYALDPELVSEERYDCSLSELENQLSGKETSLNLGDNIRAGMIAQDERSDAMNSLEGGERVKLDEYYLDPNLFTNHGYNIKKDTSLSEQLGELAGGTDLTENAKLGLLVPEDRPESMDDLDWPVNIGKGDYSLVEAATNSKGKVKSGVESCFYDPATELTDIPQVGKETQEALIDEGYESISELKCVVEDCEFSESDLSRVSNVGEATYTWIKKEVERRFAK